MVWWISQALVEERGMLGCCGDNLFLLLHSLVCFDGSAFWWGGGGMIAGCSIICQFGFQEYRVGGCS